MSLTLCVIVSDIVMSLTLSETNILNRWNLLIPKYVIKNTGVYKTKNRFYLFKLEGYIIGFTL